MKLYSMPSSGNSYKVRLLLALLGRDDIARVDCEADSPEMDRQRALGALPFGKLPVLALDDGSLLPESGAILFYLATGSRFIPGDGQTRAQMLSWMFWEQYSHEPVVAVRASLNSYPHLAHEATPEVMADLLERGHRALGVMETRLASHEWFVGDSMTLADIALYGYTHTAGPRGGFEMARFPAIHAWCARIAALPGYRGLEACETGTAAMTALTAWTDGACSGNPGPGGWGVLLRAADSDGTVLKERELQGGEALTTNNRMELMAAIQALETLTRPSAITIVTDSAYVKNGVTAWIHGWKRNGWKTAAKKPVKNVELWQRLDAAGERHTVTWQWIKGHAGHAENERADELARAGMQPFKP